MKYFGNPLNIRYYPFNQWKGQITPKRGFCQFSDSMYCYRAGFMLIRRYIWRGKRTYSQIIESFAPSSENNTAAYIRCVCDWLDVKSSDCPNTSYDIIRLIYFMSRFEQGSVVELPRLTEIFDWFRVNTDFLRCKIIG